MIWGYLHDLENLNITCTSIYLYNPIISYISNNIKYHYLTLYITIIYNHYLYIYLVYNSITLHKTHCFDLVIQGAVSRSARCCGPWGTACMAWRWFMGILGRVFFPKKHVTCWGYLMSISWYPGLFQTQIFHPRNSNKQKLTCWTNKSNKHGDVNSQKWLMGILYKQTSRVN